MSRQSNSAPSSGADGRSVLDAPTPQRIRDELAELVVTDLLGPVGGETEELPGNPTDHYIIGRLAPGGAFSDGTVVAAGHTIEPDEPDEGPIAAIPDTEEGDRDPDAPNVPSLQPSALGLTVHVDGSVDELRVRCSWARYEPGPSQDPEHPGRVRHRRPVNGQEGDGRSSTHTGSSRPG